MKKKLICLAIALALAIPVVKGIMAINHTSNIVASTTPPIQNGSGDPGDPPPVG